MEKLLSTLNVSLSNEEKQSMIDEAFKHVEIIEKLHNIGLTNELIVKNISRLYEFIMDECYCANCPGLDKCEKENPHLSFKVSYQNENIVKEMVPCKKIVKEMILQKSFINSDFSYDWFKNSLKTMDHTGQRLKAFEIYNAYLKNNEFSWLYLTGEKDTGRSYFAATLAIDYAKKTKKSVAFINAKERFSELNAYYYKQIQDYYDVMNKFMTCPLLVIDDFGDELKSDVIRDEIVLKLLAYRAENKLMTIFTSKYSINDIVDMYNKSNYAKEKALTIGRLIKKCAKNEIKLGAIPIYR